MDHDPTRFTDDEFRQLVQLLHKYVETAMDQWDRWRFGTGLGDAFIEIRYGPHPCTAADTYDDLDRWLLEE